MRKEVEFWLLQSEADLKSAKDLLKTGNFYSSVFFSHQSVEKALKALYILEKKELIKTHNLVFLARELGASDNIINNCAELTPD